MLMEDVAIRKQQKRLLDWLKLLKDEQIVDTVNL